MHANYSQVRYGSIERKKTNNFSKKTSENQVTKAKNGTCPNPLTRIGVEVGKIKRSEEGIMHTLLHAGRDCLWSEVTLFVCI